MNRPVTITKEFIAALPHMPHSVRKAPSAVMVAGVHRLGTPEFTT